MPPKGSQKPKAQELPAPKSKPKPATSTPKKSKDPIVWKSLARDTTIPIDVTFEGESSQVKVRKTGDYAHALKLVAPSSFTLLKSTVLTEGEFEGCQAIIIRPAKPFPFLKLPKEARKRIYDYYFAPKGVVDSEIQVEGKRAAKDLYAKAYADGSKNRVALLAVNKEIYEEAIQIFYAHKIRMESTTTMSDFLVQTGSAVRARLTDVAVNAWVKTTSRNAMMLLAEARNLKNLHIDSGVSSEGDTAKAAKAFWTDAYKFLEAVGAVKGDKAAGVDAVTFGQKAFTWKDDKKTARPWKDESVEEFRDILKGKLK